MATTSTSALFTRSWWLSNARATPKRLPAASADSRRLVDSAVISKSSASDLKAGMCACAAHPRSGLAPMMPTRILLSPPLLSAITGTSRCSWRLSSRRSEPDGLADEDHVDAAGGVIGLAGDRLHLLQLGREVEGHHLVARRLVPSAVVDGVRNPRLLQRDRGISHHDGALGDASEDSVAGSIKVGDDFDAEPVLFERDDGRRERLIVGQHRVSSCVGDAHRFVLLRSAGLSVLEVPDMLASANTVQN